MPLFPKPNGRKLYYDRAAGERGSQASFCGRHLPIRHSSFTVVVDKKNFVTLLNGKHWAMSCEICDGEGGPWNQESVYRKLNYIREADKVKETVKNQAKRKLELSALEENQPTSNKIAKVDKTDLIITKHLGNLQKMLVDGKTKRMTKEQFEEATRDVTNDDLSNAFGVWFGLVKHFGRDLSVELLGVLQADCEFRSDDNNI